jgi:hypothetical protein
MYAGDLSPNRILRVCVFAAGLVCKLSTRTSVVAAMNFKGGALALASPLLSRFDMVRPFKEWMQYGRS